MVWEFFDLEVDKDTKAINDCTARCRIVAKLLNTVHPFLAKLVLKYFSVCATSVSSERVFSTSGNIVTPHSMNLNTKKVEMLTFLSENL